MRHPDILILGGGEIRDYNAVARRIGASTRIICADSGYDHCHPLGVTPHLLVGDFDSVRSVLPPEIPRLPLPPEKDYTDTTHAIEEALRLGPRSLLLAGMLGGRLDHTWANLQSLTHLSRRGVEACLTDGMTDVMAVTAGSIVLEPRQHCYFSLFALSESCTGVNIRDARYLLRDHTLTFDEPRAVSNEFIGKAVSVSVCRGTLAVMLVPMDRELLE